MERAYVIDQHNIPWTASLPTWLIILVNIGSGGTILLALGCYLVVWVWRRFKGAFALPVYLVMLLSAVLLYFPVPTALRVTLEWISTCAYVAGCFALRYDMQRYFFLKHGSNLEIGPMLKLLFGPAYVNYCLSLVYNGEAMVGARKTSIVPPQ